MAAPAAAQPSVEVRDVLRGVWHRRSMILGFALIATVLAIAFVLISTPKYTTQTQVLVENLETPFNRLDKINPQTGRIEDRDVLSQVEVIKSSNLARQVIKHLNLHERPEFDPLKRGMGLFSSLFVQLGFGTDPNLQTVEQRAMTAFYKGLNVYQIPQSKVIVIRFTSSDPKLAASVANTLADFYVRSTREVNAEPTTRARDWLSSQIDALRAKVIESEIAIEKFRSEAGLQRGGQQGTLNNQELSELNSQIILAKAARSEAEARARTVRDLLKKRGTIETSSEALNSQLIQRLREQQVTLKRRIAQLSTTYLPSHPKVVGVDRELRDLDKQIRGEMLKIVKGLEEQAKIAASREASLRAGLATLKVKVSRSGADDVRLRSLEREATANRKLLETYLEKFTAAKSTQEAGAQSGMARIISTADVPTQPSFPRIGPVVMLALLAGLFGGTGLAFLIEVMGAASMANAAIAVPAQQPLTQAKQGVPVIPDGARTGAVFQSAEPFAAPKPPSREKPVPAATVPSHAIQHAGAIGQVPAAGSVETAKLKAMSVAGSGDSDYARQLQPMAMWIGGTAQENAIKAIAIGAMPGCEVETATACVGLGRILSAHNIKTLLIDADMKSGGVNAIVDIPEGRAGLSELLQGTVDAANAIVRDTASSLHVLSSGANRATAQTQLLSHRMTHILEACQDTFDIVLVHDGATLFPAQTSGSVIAQVKAALILAGEAHSAEAAALTAALKKAGLLATGFATVSAAQAGDQNPVNVEAA